LQVLLKVIKDKNRVGCRKSKHFYFWAPDGTTRKCANVKSPALQFVL
jgi:hypothetical protein